MSAVEEGGLHRPVSLLALTYRGISVLFCCLYQPSTTLANCGSPGTRDTPCILHYPLRLSPDISTLLNVAPTVSQPCLCLGYVSQMLTSHSIAHPTQEPGQMADNVGPPHWDQTNQLSD